MGHVPDHCQAVRRCRPLRGAACRLRQHLATDDLAGAPGVFSARYAGEHASDADRRQQLLSELSNHSDRRARFVSVVAIADPTGTVLNVSEGICNGTLTYAPRGNGGFGYDPLFIPDCYTQTFAELPENIKNRISHRALALVQTKEFLAADLRR